MSQLPDTRPTLLLRLRDAQDSEAWSEFADVYGPVVRRYGLRRGLQDADAADLVQQVLHSVARSIDSFEYDPARGSFRGWLFTVTRNLVFKALDERRRVPTATGDTAFQQSLEEQAADAEEWDQDCRRQVFQKAAERVHPDFTEATWRAFWRTAVLGEPAAEVAEALGISSGAVYVAKSRVTAKMREAVSELSDE